MDKLDYRNHKKEYFSWKERYGKRIPYISKTNSQIILDYLHDMEYGLNVGKSSRKGGRSYTRLNNIKQRMIFLTKLFEKIYGIDSLYELEERQLHRFFTDMRNGIIKRVDGEVYRDPANFVKLIKAFWHWHQKVNRKKGIEIYDITQDLDTSVEKPRWVYLTEEEIRKLLVIDEAWSLLRQAHDASYIFEIVKTCRKFNLALFRPYLPPRGLQGIDIKPSLGSSP